MLTVLHGFYILGVFWVLLWLLLPAPSVPALCLVVICPLLSWLADLSGVSEGTDRWIREFDITFVIVSKCRVHMGAEAALKCTYDIG